MTLPVDTRPEWPLRANPSSCNIKRNALCKGSKLAMHHPEPGENMKRFLASLFCIDPGRLHYHSNTYASSVCPNASATWTPQPTYTPNPTIRRAPKPNSSAATATPAPSQRLRPTATPRRHLHRQAGGHAEFVGPAIQCCPEAIIAGHSIANPNLLEVDRARHPDVTAELSATTRSHNAQAFFVGGTPGGARRAQPAPANFVYPNPNPVPGQRSDTQI